MKNLRLENKVAIITGAAVGIGKGIALGFAQEGAHIIIADVNQEASEETAEEIRQFGQPVLVVPTDVGAYDQNQQLVDKTLNQF